mmetsp:Transcript_3917/g.9188  ORF Transcript_3917/g.9188 Transcript_3917/m.9188 type:complete len:414 (+) Transcript_3917:547-1788(+)
MISWDSPAESPARPVVGADYHTENDKAIAWLLAALRRDADHDYRALESAARCEWVRKFTHMGSLHSAVIARHTFTPDTINAIRESNLPNALEGIVGQRARKSDADAARALDNKSTRSGDNDVIVRALVLLSHASNEEEFDSAVVSIHEMFLVGVDAAARSRRWSLLTENWLVAESNTLKRVLQKKKTLMKTSGDANARKPTDDEVMKNNLTISDLFKLAVGSCFWILDYGTNNTIPARTPPTIQSPNPDHNGASYPVFRLKYKVVTGRIRQAGKERVYDVKCPGDRPPLGWNIRIVGNSIETSRVVVGGSRYVLCAVIRKVPSTKAKSGMGWWGRTFVEDRLLACHSAARRALPTKRIHSNAVPEGIWRGTSYYLVERSQHDVEARAEDRRGARRRLRGGFESRSSHGWSDVN